MINIFRLLLSLIVVYNINVTAFKLSSKSQRQMGRGIRIHNIIEMRILNSWISPLKQFTSGLKYFDTDKESNRKFRRTIFTKYDWRKHRSGNRYFSELLSMPKSVVLRGLTVQALTVTFFSIIMCAYNVSIELGFLPKWLPIICAPTLPFSLTSSALGLLLVFRTNAAYSRWKDARIAWAVISAKSFDIMRQSIAWIDDNGIKATIVRYLTAYSKCLKWQLGHQGNDRKLVEDLSGMLGPKELELLMASRNRPQYLLFRLSYLLRESGLLPNLQAHIDRSICDITVSMTTCERIFSTPIPLMYTRHTARFLMLWLLTVPTCLYNEFKLYQKWMIPVTCFLHSIFLFGIEELGVQIEEPFSILPMANICSDIQRSGEDMLYDANVPWFYTTEDSKLDMETRDKSNTSKLSGYDLFPSQSLPNILLNLDSHEHSNSESNERTTTTDTDLEEQKKFFEINYKLE